MSNTRSVFISRIVLSILAATCAGSALAQTVEGNGPSKVMMFDRPPSVDELRSLVSPPSEPAPAPMPKFRTRGIEIVGSGIAAGQRPKPIEQANTGATESFGQQTYGQSGQGGGQSGPVSETAATPAGNQPGAFGFRINFALNSTVIPREAQSYLDAVGGLMTQEPQVALLIKGHTDASGSDSYNQVLSEHRAAAVQDYLVRSYRIDPARVVTQGRGEAEPLTENPYDGKNRRVEFERIR